MTFKGITHLNKLYALISNDGAPSSPSSTSLRPQLYPAQREGQNDFPSEKNFKADFFEEKELVRGMGKTLPIGEGRKRTAHLGDSSCSKKIRR